MTYERPSKGSWIQPIKRGYKMMCCDCSLVHTMNFRTIICVNGQWVLWEPGLAGSDMKIQFQAARNERSTGQARRKYEQIHLIKKPTALKGKP